MRKSVKKPMFFPQESTNEIIAPARKAYFIFRLSTNKHKIAKKKTIAPIYAGAETPG